MEPMKGSEERRPGVAPGRYVLITPTRNERATIASTIRSVLRQIHRPAEWVVVDDGSSDGTYELLQSELGSQSFARLVRRDDRGFSQVGAGVVEAFLEGLSAVECGDYRYLGKLDADIELEADYFAELVSRLDSRPGLGIASGQNYLRSASGELEVEYHAPYHPVGGARLYRRDLFKRIGGLVATPGWDTLDLVRARMRGFETRNFGDLKVVHLRPMGTRGELREAVLRQGRVSYLMGYSRLYFLARILYHMSRPPRPRRGLWLLAGYLQAALGGERRVLERDEVRWFRRFQRRRLLRGDEEVD